MPQVCTHADAKFHQVDNQYYPSPKVTLLLCGLSMHLLYRIHTQRPEAVAELCMCSDCILEQNTQIWLKKFKVK